MGAALGRTLLYGLIAAASPLALAATAVVLRSSRGRLNGAIFAGAFLLGESIVVLTVIVIGSAAAPGRGGSRTAGAVLELILGVLLLVAAGRLRAGSRSALREPSTGGRTQALLARLGRLTPAAAFWAGLLLGIGGPKRLTVAIVAATTIAAAGLTTRQELAVGAVYVLVAGLLVWAPVAAYLVFGSRARASLAAVDSWVMTNQRLFAEATLYVFGGALVADALVQLV